MLYYKIISTLRYNIRLYPNFSFTGPSTRESGRAQRLTMEVWVKNRSINLQCKTFMAQTIYFYKETINALRERGLPPIFSKGIENCFTEFFSMMTFF